MPTILIGGYYGAGNIGDEAILAAMLKELRTQRPDISFVVISWDPEKTSSYFGVDSIHWKDIPALLNAATRSDLIILGGGGLFFDYWGIEPDTYLRINAKDITMYGSLPLLAELMNIPCMIYAIGIGPIKSEAARIHTRLAFERCQVATIRDRESLEVLKNTGFTYGNPQDPIVKILPDPVFSLTTDSSDDETAAKLLEKLDVKETAKLLGINLRYWDFGNSLEKWLPNIARCLEKILNQEKDVQVLLIPFHVSFISSPHTNDVAVLEKLSYLLNMPDRVFLIREAMSPQLAQALIKRTNVMVGMRLHSLIMGMNVGTPIVALPYDPKIHSAMKRFGLEKYCAKSLSPQVDDFVSIVMDAWNFSPKFHSQTQILREELHQLSKQHAVHALNLLNQSRYNELQFSQQFALEQIRLLYKADKKIEQLQEKTNHLVPPTPTKEDPIKKDFIISGNDDGNIVNDVVNTLNSRSLKGIFIVTSAFVFDELFNQRVINLSKFLSTQGWGVVYIAWRWNTEEAMPSIGKEVYKNIFQVPIDMFLNHVDAFAYTQYIQKYFVVEFPYPNYFQCALKLRRMGFNFIYEIIDDWEEFHKVGMAIWFNEAFEKAFVINANFVTAVSPPLVQKFSNLRLDIQLIPNGYDPRLLGEIHRNISQKSRKQKDEIHLGYFGHLTDTWFDWNFLLKVLDLARHHKIKLHLHLIGYGEPNLDEKLASYSEQVKFYGKVHPNDLHQYAKTWDAAIIWFKSGKLADAVDPIKIYEYLYFGLPTIVKGINHTTNYPLTQVVTNEQEALNAIITLHNDQLNDPEFTTTKQTVNEFLTKSTWQQRFTNMLNIFKDQDGLSF